jgi:hypothetical protein
LDGSPFQSAEPPEGPLVSLTPPDCSIDCNEQYVRSNHYRPTDATGGSAPQLHEIGSPVHHPPITAHIMINPMPTSIVTTNIETGTVIDSATTSGNATIGGHHRRNASDCTSASIRSSAFK